MKSILSFAAALAALTLLAAPLAGQENPGQAPSASQASVPDEQLRSFAEAYVGIVTIQRKIKPQLQAAEQENDSDRVKDLKKQATGEMVSAIEGAGLSVEEYNRITQRLRGNQELGQRLKEMLQQLRPE